MSVLDEITMFPLQPSQYINEESVKTQIYLHHTASSSNPFSAIRWWQTTPERIGTSFVIGGPPPPKTTESWVDGQILQAFGSKKWAWHLGIDFKGVVKTSQFKSNKELNKNSIGIEICNWGQLKKTPDGFKTYTGKILPDSLVVEYPTPFRDYLYYEKYTNAQLEQTRKLLAFLCERWGIPKTFMGMQIFDLDTRAFTGTPGIFTHVSVRKDKNDCHPQKELVDMLKAI